MTSKTLTSAYATYTVTGSLFTLTNKTTVGSTTVSTGILVSGTNDIIQNGGSATGQQNGIYLQHGGTVFNQASGTISGHIGILAANGAATITNAGTIAGTTDSVLLTSGFANRVVDDPGSIFAGTVDGGNTIGATAASTLELASGASIGTLTGFGTQFVDFSQVALNYGANWITASDTFGTGITVTNSGLANGITLSAGATLLNQFFGIVGYQSFGGAGNSPGAVSATGATVSNVGEIYGGKTGIAATSSYIYDSGQIRGVTYGISASASAIVLAGYALVTSNLGVGVGDGLFGLNDHVTVGSGARVYGRTAGAFVTSSYVLNNGYISSATQGVQAGSDSTLINNGKILALSLGSTNAVYDRASVLVNSGKITGNTDGVLAESPTGPAPVTNTARGFISGVQIGVHTTSLLINYGTIVGTNIGVLETSGTVVNAGTIQGFNTAAVTIGLGSLIIEPGAVFAGKVIGAGGKYPAGILEFASGAAAGILSGLGSQYSGIGTVEFDAGARWTITGSNPVSSSAIVSGLTFVTNPTIINNGTLTLLNATFSDVTTLTNNGNILLDPSTMTLAGLIGAGGVTIETGSTLGITGTVSASETIAFAGTSGTLQIDPTKFSGQIDGIRPGDTLILTGITDAATPAILAGNILAIPRTGGPTLDLALDPGANYAGNLFVPSTSGGNTIITQEAPCFLAGTLIRTPSGEVPVQDLREGELITTLSGHARPIAWIGTGRVLISPGRRCAATPVIVRKNAIGPTHPNADLRITKGHALFIDDVLIPVEFLVNHRSILWDDHRGEVTFYHIELDTHDVLLANGAPAETYRDDGNRWLFRNAKTGWDRPAKPPCAPVLTGGPIVDAVWRRLLDRTEPRPGIPLTGDPDLHLLTDGTRVEPDCRTGSIYVFRLPHPPSSTRILSRSAAPAELGIARDARVLGVAITRIVLSKGRALRVMEPENPAMVSGFHAYEPELAQRWTDGDALIPPELFDGLAGAVTLELHVTGAARYPVDQWAA